MNKQRESKFDVDYSGAGAGTHDSPYAYDFLSGKIRIWTKDGTDSRSAAPFPTGDLIQPGMAYSVAELIPDGERIFYVEAIQGSDSVGDIQITAHLESEGETETWEDSVRATVFHIEAVHPIPEDFGSNAGKIMIYPSALSDTS